MLRDEKWIAYAVRTLQAVEGGANTIARIAHDIGGSQSYLAKVIATLRKGGLLTEQTELTIPLDSILISRLVILADPNLVEDSINRYIAQQLLSGLNTLSVKQVLENHELVAQKV